jgi:type I restriction enzyme, S subunit
VEWLDQIPSDWSVMKFRHVFRESPEKIENEVVGPMLSVSGYRGIEIKEYDDDNRRRTNEELVGYRIVRSGQLVVNTMWLNYAGLGVSDYEGHVSPAYRSYWIDPRMDHRYVHHLLRSSIYVQGYTRLLTGIRPNSLQMSRDDLMEFPILQPPVEVQQRIAGFLDAESAKIDRLIVEQQRLIELLKEKRQTVISNAVTKGMNAGTPTKASGIEWLGNVPEHWALPPLYMRYESLLGKMLDEKRNVGKNALPYLRNVDVQWDHVNVDNLPLIDIEPAEYDRFTVRSGDLLVCEGGEVGRAAIWDGRLELCAYQKALHRLRPVANGEVVRFLYYCFAFAAHKEVFVAGSNPNTIPHLTGEQLRLYRFPKPPEAEQHEIVKKLDQETAKIDALINEQSRSKELLMERRAALISAAVTGRIDVRGPANVDAEAA